MIAAVFICGEDSYIDVDESFDRPMRHRASRGTMLEFVEKTDQLGVSQRLSAGSHVYAGDVKCIGAGED